MSLMQLKISPNFDRDTIPVSGRARPHTSTYAKTLPPSFSPQLAVLGEHPPLGEGWIHEIKFDGYRILAFIERGNVKLITRNGHDWTQKFPGIAGALASLQVQSAILDGELVVLDDKGRSDFQALQALMKGRQPAEPVFYVFDLPFCNGSDLTAA